AYQVNPDLSGVGTNDIVASTSGPEALTGGGGNDLLFGNGGSDNSIDGGNGNDLIIGGAGNDVLIGGSGNDTLVGGTEADNMTGGANSDVFVLGNAALGGPGNIDTITDYTLSQGDVIDITDALSVTAGTNVVTGGYVRVTTTGLVQVDVNGGGDNWVTLSNINLAATNVMIRYVLGGVVTDLSIARSGPPVALDMDGDGHVSFLATDAGATFDYGAGKVATAWVAGNDGILVRDANHDGQASANEIVFATTGSDLQGLAVYDSNHDGKLSSADAVFADFQVWQDANSNGVVDAGEMRSLMALGIASISLSSDGVGYSAAGGDVQVVGTGSYTRTDGSTGVLADAVFTTGGAVADEQAKAATSSASNAALIAAVAAAGLAASEPLAAATFHAAGDSNAQPLDVTAYHSQAFAPVALDATDGSASASIVTAFANGAQSQVAPGGSSLHAADEGTPAAHADKPSAPVAEPIELLQGSDAPVHDQVQAMAPLTAAGIAVPSAAQLGVAPAADAAVAGQHNQVVAQVLAEALAGGGHDGPSIDTLIAGLPQQVHPGPVTHFF